MLKPRTSLCSSCRMERITHHPSTSTSLSQSWKKVLEFTVKCTIRHKFWSDYRFLAHIDVIPDLTHSLMVFREYCDLCEAHKGQPWGSCGSHHRCALSHRWHRQAWGDSIRHHQPSFTWTHRVHYASRSGHLHLQPARRSSQPCGVHTWQPWQHPNRKLSVSLRYKTCSKIC